MWLVIQPHVITVLYDLEYFVWNTKYKDTNFFQKVQTALLHTNEVDGD